MSKECSEGEKRPGDVDCIRERYSDMTATKSFSDITPSPEGANADGLLERLAVGKKQRERERERERGKERE